MATSNVHLPSRVAAYETQTYVNARLGPSALRFPEHQASRGVRPFNCHPDLPRAETCPSQVKDSVYHVASVNGSPTPCVWSLILGILSAERNQPQNQEQRHSKRKN